MTLPRGRFRRPEASGGSSRPAQTAPREVPGAPESGMKHRQGSGSIPPYRPAQPLDDLARPKAYPAPRPTTVDLVTTHISWVCITDHEVWN